MIQTLRNLRWYFSRRTSQSYQPIILVTGCSSGIGLAIARNLYSQSKYRVVVTARKSSIEELRKEFVENENFRISTLDVTDHEERYQLIAEIRAVWGGVDILINNAGICYRAVLEHMTEMDERQQMKTNYLGPMSLIRLVLPYMRSAGRGKIINVSSVSGMVAMPTMTSYSASKHALEGASEALWYEAKPFGIDVSIIQPGFVKSKSFERVYLTEASRFAIAENRIYSDYYRSLGPFISKLMNLSFTTPDSVARTIIRTIQTENPPLWVPATLDAIVFNLLRSFLPRRLFSEMLFRGLPGSGHWGERTSKSRKRTGFSSLPARQ